jgi:predicted GNAT family N-acyltransferase
MNVQIHPCNITDILDLRHDVLRKELPIESALFPGDDAPTSKHFAATLHSKVIACLTLHLNSHENHPAYQLRGMAVAKPHRNQHLGQQLLAAAEAFILTTPLRTLWCNARSPAVHFYTKNGWQIISTEFDIPTAGPHFKMLRILS